jgi:hypothetical protein
MELPDATTDYVFTELESSLNLSAMQFRKSNLFDVFKKRLEKEKEQSKAWEMVSEYIMTSESNPYRTYSPLMRDIYCMKYTFPIGQDPRALLPKPVRVHIPSQIEEIEGSEFLVCNEEEEGEDKENTFTFN